LLIVLNAQLATPYPKKWNGGIKNKYGKTFCRSQREKTRIFRVNSGLL